MNLLKPMGIKEIAKTGTIALFREAKYRTGHIVNGYTMQPDQEKQYWNPKRIFGDFRIEASAS